MTRSLSEQTWRPISGRGETGGRNVDGKPVTPHGRISRADLGLTRLIAAGPLGPPEPAEKVRGWEPRVRTPRVGRRHRAGLPLLRDAAARDPRPGATWPGPAARTDPCGQQKLISCSCGAAGASWIGWTRRAAVEAAGGSRCAQAGCGPRGRVGTAPLRPWRGDRRHRTRHRPRARRGRAGRRPCGRPGCRFRCGKSCSGRPRDSRSGAPSPAHSS